MKEIGKVQWTKKEKDKDPKGMKEIKKGETSTRLHGAISQKTVFKNGDDKHIISR
jgi:hypothetical protein